MSAGPDAVRELIERYGLQAHPEGGYFAESYRSEGRLPASALGGGFPGERRYSTAIYFLLPSGAKSRLHRLRSDELWHFYLGGPLRVIELTERGPEETVLGQDFSAGHRLQHAVRAGRWFGSIPAPGTAFSLVGCTVAPGFDFADFELGRREDLLRAFPGSASAIRELTD